MNRLIKCVQFQMKSMMKRILYFMMYYSVIYIALILLLSLVNPKPDSGGNIVAGFSISGAIFVFIIITVSYKSIFNFLLMFGNTRKNIFLSSVSAITLASVALSAISVLFDLLDKFFVSKVVNNFNVEKNMDLLNTLIYKKGVTIAEEFLWYAAMFILVCSFALLYGSLRYKFGKAFTIAFWVGLSLISTFVPTLAGIDDIAMLNALKAYLCIGVPNGILLAPVNFIITAVVLSAVTYAVTARQPQTA